MRVILYVRCFQHPLKRQSRMTFCGIHESSDSLASSCSKYCLWHGPWCSWHWESNSLWAFWQYWNLHSRNWSMWSGCTSATLYFQKRDIASNSPVSDAMKMYCGNTGFCRCKLLMRVFEAVDEITFPSPIHKCCDVYERECSCQVCSTSSSPITVETSAQSVHTREQLSPHQQNTLRKLLTVYRDGQCGSYICLLKHFYLNKTYLQMQNTWFHSHNKNSSNANAVLQ